MSAVSATGVVCMPGVAVDAVSEPFAVPARYK